MFIVSKQAIYGLGFNIVFVIVDFWVKALRILQRPVYQKQNCLYVSYLMFT